MAVADLIESPVQDEAHASALLELYADRASDEELAGLVEAMLPIELRALGL